MAEKKETKKTTKKTTKRTYSKDPQKRYLLKEQVFSEKLCDIARKAALLGLDNQGICNLLDITPATFYGWMKKNADFRAAIKRGKSEQILDVVDALYARAVGFTRIEQEVVNPGGKGDAYVINVEKYYPPSVTACKAILATRDPDNWNPKKIIELSGRLEQEKQIIVYQVPENNRNKNN